MQVLLLYDWSANQHVIIVIITTVVVVLHLPLLLITIIRG